MGRCGNVASIMEVKDGGVVDKSSFKIFEAGADDVRLAFRNANIALLHSTGSRDQNTCSDGRICELIAGLLSTKLKYFIAILSLSTRTCCWLDDASSQLYTA